MEILTRFEIKHVKGATLFNTADFNELQYLDMPHDKEGFPVRHFSVGTEFNILPSDQGNEGRYKIVGLFSAIYDDPNSGNSNSDTYKWGLHIIYHVERIQ